MAYDKHLARFDARRSVHAPSSVRSRNTQQPTKRAM